MAPENILSRIQKLLNLATSDNEHEAASAAARAQDLMLRHHVTEHDLREQGGAAAPVEPVGTEHIAEYFSERRAGEGRYYKKGGVVPYWHLRLSHALARAFCCETYYTPGFHITLVGRASDRAVVRYLFDFLRVEILRFAKAGWQRAQTEGAGELPRAVDWLRAFCVGAVDTIAARLVDPAKGLPAPVAASESAPAQSQTSTALVLRERAAEVSAWLKANVKLSGGGGNTGGNARRTSGYAEGKAAGHSLSLSGRGARGALGSGR